MTKKRLFISLGVIFIAFFLAALLILPFRQDIQFFLGNLVSRGAVSKDQAAATKCNGKDIVCTIKDGKIQSKKLSSGEIKKMEKQYASPRERNIQYADNVAEAVQAIRKYTGVGDLDLALMEGTSPAFISYYCTKNNKCWAVDNDTHQVLPGIK